MVLGVDHIGIAVADIEKALAVYRDALGLAHVHTEEVPEQGVATYSLKAGSVDLELLSPIREESPVGKFIAKKGGGLHHVALQVDDIEAELKRLREAGLEPLSERPSVGAGGKKIVFFHPRSTAGVLLELCQRPKE